MKWDNNGKSTQELISNLTLELENADCHPENESVKEHIVEE